MYNIKKVLNIKKKINTKSTKTAFLYNSKQQPFNLHHISHNSSSDHTFTYENRSKRRPIYNRLRTDQYLYPCEIITCYATNMNIYKRGTAKGAA